jgi:ribosomal silencing factor RsfS
MSPIKPIPVYNTIKVMEYQSIFHNIREHVRNSIHTETQYNINEVLDWVVVDSVHVSVGDNVNATLREYGYSN